MKLLLIIFLFTSNACDAQFFFNGWRYSTDPATTAFENQVIANGGSISATEKTAINNLVVAYKAAGIWTKRDGIAPWVGSSAAAFAVNLKNPSGTAFTFPNGATYNSTGIDWNGSNQYVNTGFDLSGLSASSQSIVFYSRQNVNEPSIDMGGGSAGNNSTDIELYNTNIYSFNGTQGSDYATNSLSTTVGVFMNNRIASGNFQIYQDATLLATKTATGGVNAGFLLFIGANAGGGNSPGFYSTKECGFAAWGQGLDATERAAELAAINAFKTALSR